MNEYDLGLVEYRRSRVLRFFTNRWISEGYNFHNVGALGPKNSGGKMSTVCQGFVQNAWKKDFCSNCFKSRDEHAGKETQRNGYFSSPFQNKNSISSKSNKSSSPHGILKASSKKKNKRAVSFKQDVCQVIGYGGDVWSDDEEFELSEDTEEVDFIPDGEEEKQLKVLTKSNTDFNSVKANLTAAANGDVKKSYTSLLLGRMQTDSDGKKKTLHVSVTPFGHENSFKNGLTKLVEKKSSIPSINKKENKSDYKTNIILTSFVKNCDTTINNPSKRDSDPDIMLSEKSLLEEISETLEKNRINYANNKPNENNETKKSTDAFNGANQKSHDKSIDIFEYKKNPISRNNPIKKDTEKPKINLSTKPEFTFCKIDIEPVNPTANEMDNEINSNNYTQDLSKAMTSDEDSFSSKSDSSDNDDRQFLETRNHLKKNDDCLKIQIFSNNKDSDSDDKMSSDISLEDIRKVDGQSDSLQDTYENHFQPKILDMPTILPKIEHPPLFSAEASRELAGEPDGRADPEETSEPPALPRSPPPQMDPRPSFLHGMIKDSVCKPVLPEKPKLPVKPLSVMKQITKRSQPNAFPQQQLILQLQQTLNNNPSKNFIETVQSNEEEDLKHSDIIETINTSTNYDMECESPLKSSLSKQDSSSSLNLTPNKRKAPKPPPSTPCEENSGSIYQRNPTASVKSDSPVVREKEKRERASSCSPKFRQNVNLNPCGDATQYVEKVPEPAPRRSLSLSHDNLIGVDDKKKGKLKFSLRKLLRLGSTKELDKKEFTVEIEPKTNIKKEEVAELTPRPKPRLVIIHPLELNGSSVEVVKTNTEMMNGMKQLNNDDISLSDGSTYSYSSVGDTDESCYKEHVHNKPPPPPRKMSDDGVNPIDGCPMKPARPPPPKSASLLRQQKQPIWSPPPSRPTDNVYANLGEVRSAIAPRKPERTASMREREAQLELPKKRMPSSDDQDVDCDSDMIKIEIVHSINEHVGHNYDDVYGSDKYDGSSDNPNKHIRNGSDSDYEFVSNCSSTPQIHSGVKKLYPININREKASVKSFTPSAYRKSDCGIDNKSVDYLKLANNFVRSTSLPYCASESESEIYSPYSFYSCSEMNNDENNGEFNNNVSVNNTTNKLRVRKGRSVVHKNLEDNYGAVVIANHEALAQVLEQVQQSAIMQPSLRGLKTCTNLRWSDFTITSSNSKMGLLKVGKRIFHSAVWNSSSANGGVNVTLMLHKDQMASLVSQQHVQPQSVCLNAVTEFCDLVPLQQFGEEGELLVQATVVVLAHSQMDTLETFGEYLKSKCPSSPSNTLVKSGKSEKESPFLHETQHEATFMMLQLINGLKCLQARGVEEVPPSLSSFVISRDLQSLVKSQQNSTCNSTENNPEDGPPSIQMPKANFYGRLCVLQGLIDENCCNASTEDIVCSLCECAIIALKLLLPNDKLTPLIEDLLSKEKAISLNQVKSILEFTLWGPWDVVLGLPIKERELSLQRWLDLERATVLHGLVRTRVQLNVFEQSHLMFLVRSTSKIMCETSVLLESSNIYKS